MAQAIGVRLRNLLKLPKAHKWVCYEWFYSNLDMWVHNAVIYLQWINVKMNMCVVLHVFSFLQTPIFDGEWLFYLHEGVFPTAKDEEAEEGGVV